METENITMDRSALIKKYGSPPNTLTNRSVIKIFKDSSHMPTITAAQWLAKWLNLDLDCTKLRCKIHRVAQKAGKLRGTSLETFLEKSFEVNQPAVPTPILTTPTTSTSSLSTSTPPIPDRAISPHPTPTRPKKLTTPKKQINTQMHTLSKKKKHIETLKSRLSTLQESKAGHYSIKNVKRREDRYAAQRMEWKEERSRLHGIVKRKEEENHKLAEELKKMKTKCLTLEKKVKSQRKKLNAARKDKKIALQRAKYHQSRRNAKIGNESSEVADDGGDRLVMEMKGIDGEFTDRVRLCVMELAGLEVATGKIGEVMKTVGDLCSVEFLAVPSRTASQCIVDEGHVLAKEYVKENVMKRCKSFGVHKDGTSRKKVKILDTSIHTDNGESFCLGWSSVTSETGQAIADEAKEKLEEVVDDQSRCEILEKLQYFMNDRASNEKKSSRLLEEWRKEMLEGTGIEAPEVHHLYCAAHVLLGFHSYTVNAIKKLDFLSSSDMKHPIEILMKDVADLFGPVGSYKGLRNVWEAYCMEKGMKSCIKAYKDNRFNGLFEVAAQLTHHLQDILHILQTHSTGNTRQTRLINALTNPDLILLSRCLGLFFHSVTGPFWTMVISTHISHQNFKMTIHQLQHSLHMISKDPNIFFSPGSFSCLPFKSSSAETRCSLPTSMMNEKMATLVSSISSALHQTLEVQLKDVLESTNAPNVQAPLTNLVCERNFGHLDASQRRRPHSSLHHHSSVMLLKQTRGKLRHWYDKLNKEKKESLWRKARKESRMMRKVHNMKDRKAIMGCLVLKGSKVTGRCLAALKTGEMVAVACDTAWYPALVEQDSAVGEDVIVNFAQLGKALGSFQWPKGNDVHAVQRNSIVETNLDIEVRAGGRWWMVKNAKDIQKQFLKFK